MRILLLLFTFISISLSAQKTFNSNDPVYISGVTLGEAALNAEKYDSCLIYYAQAFEIKKTSVLSTLRAAACAFSNGNQPIEQVYLDTCFSVNWDMTKRIFDDYPEFEYLRDSDFQNRIYKRWEETAISNGIDLELMAEMKEIRVTDQAQRGEMRGISDKYGWDSPQMDSLWKLQTASDVANTNRIIEIIEKHGYPGKSLVGASNMGTAFLVIQHSEQETQEKYLPVLKEAAEAGEVRWSSVALLIDRVALGQGKKQTYGSQVSNDKETNEYFFSEIENPYQIDSIRASVGLSPLQRYADNWDFQWDPDKHIARHKKMKEEAAKADKK